MGNVERGLFYLHRAVATHPNHSLAHYRLGRLYLVLGRPEAALGHFKAALNKASSSPDMHNAHGVALFRLGRLVESETSFKKAIELRPDLMSYQCNLAFVLEQQGKKDLAAQIYASVLAKTEKAGRPWPADACQYALRLLRAQPPDPLQALELAQQACQATQFKDVPCLTTLADVQTASGQGELAKANYRLALSLATDPATKESLENKLRQ